MIPLTRPQDDHVAPGPSNLTDATSTPGYGVVTNVPQGPSNQAVGIDVFEQLLAEAEQKSLEQELSRLEVALGTIMNQSSALESALSSPS